MFALNRGTDAPPLLLDAAKQLEPLDAGLAREAYLEALGAAIFAGRLNDRVGPAEVAAAAQAAPPGRQPPQPTDLLLDGLVMRFTAGYGAGVAPLRRALTEFAQDNGGDEGDFCAGSGCRASLPPTCGKTRCGMTSPPGRSGSARESGALMVLPLALGYRAPLDLLAGEFARHPR